MRFIITLAGIAFLLAGASDACTTFLLDTPEGPVYGANLDLFIPGDGLVFINRRGIAKEGFQKNINSETAQWVSRYGSITFNLAGREFAFGGMNEAGLVVGSMELLDSKFPEPDERMPLTMGMWAQYVLDTCSTLDEVIACDKKVRIEDSAPPVHFLISDSEGNCVTIEFFDGNLHYRRGDNLPVKALTNSTYDESLAKYNAGGPRWWQRDRGATFKRFCRAAERNRDFDPDGELNCIEYAFETLTRDVAAGHTKWSIVYHIPRREVWFRSVRSPEVKYVSLNDFDLSPDAPCLMMDVNLPAAWHVKDSFIPYDHDQNLQLLRTLCARYELNVSDAQSEEIVRHVEEFKKAAGY
jgi:choloylglycine hydrolase